MAFLEVEVLEPHYAVSADFILSTLLDYFKPIRQRRPGTISLGVGVSLLIGPRAQEIIRTAVAAAFPMVKTLLLNATRGLSKS